MFTALVLGIAGGFVLSIPPGPLSVAVTKQGIEGHFRSGFSLALGAAAMDVIYSLLAAFTSSAIVTTLRNVLTGNTWFPLAFQIVCVVVLLVLGVRYFRQRHDGQGVREARYKSAEELQEERAKRLGYSHPFFIGVLVAITNLASPTFLPSLVGFVGYLHANRLLTDGALSNILYSAGFGIGTSLWFFLLLRVIIRHRTKLSSTFLSNIYKFAGGTFFVFAALIMYNVIVTTEWTTLFSL